MVNISISEDRRQSISMKYYDRIVRWIDEKKMWTNLGDAFADSMMDEIHSHSREYFLASPNCLKALSDEFSKRYAEKKKEYEDASRKNKPLTSYGRFVKRMRKIYNGFMKTEDSKGKKNGYWLMTELGVGVCPYCNINYTTTINTRTIRVRPEYDHFFPEAMHPSLILSFYNLVPSCPQCNHLKRVQELDVNPWVRCAEGEGPTFRVDTSKGDFPKNPIIKINDENENIKKLGIKELYNEHKDYVKDILDKIQAYNPATYHAIATDFQGIVHTEADLDRMVWGNYTELRNSDKRPLAKLTRDILEQYKKYL